MPVKDNILGIRIAALRLGKGLTQLEFCKFLNISNTTLSQYESGKRIPSDNVLINIADFFDVSLDYLFGRTDRKDINDRTVNYELLPPEAEAEMLSFKEYLKHKYSKK